MSDREFYWLVSALVAGWWLVGALGMFLGSVNHDRYHAGRDLATLLPVAFAGPVAFLIAEVLRRDYRELAGDPVRSPLRWLSDRLPCRVIEIDGAPYLRRYYVGRVFGVTFYLHEFVSADHERHLHNHPWRRGFSIVLSGHYYEDTAVDLCPHAGGTGCLVETRRVRWFNRVDGNSFHRIGAARAGTWTLFAHGKRQRVRCGMASRLKGWGFLESVDSETTIFRPYPSAARTWWVDAPVGADVARPV